MFTKKNRKITLTLLIFFFSLISYIYPKLPSACLDCGSISNCLNGNGLNTGWTACVIISSPSGISCEVGGHLCY